MRSWGSPCDRRLSCSSHLYKKTMRTVSVADARSHFADLIDSVGSGQAVVITRRGREVARLIPSTQGGRPLPSRAEERQALVESGAKVGGSVVRKMRDEERA